MDRLLANRIIRYRTAISISIEMHRRGIITRDDYGVVCTILAKENGLDLSTIFSEIDLLSLQKDGNMHH